MMNFCTKTRELSSSTSPCSPAKDESLCADSAVMPQTGHAAQPSHSNAHNSVRTDADFIATPFRVHSLAFSLRLVANRFDIVSIRIQNERAIVVLVVVRPRTRTAVVFSASGKRGSIELVHLPA